MSETITINVSVEDAKALASLNNLQSLVDQLNKTAIKIPASVAGGSGNSGNSGFGGMANSAQNAGNQLQSLQGYITQVSESTKYLNGELAEFSSIAKNNRGDTLKTTFKSTGETVQNLTRDLREAASWQNRVYGGDGAQGYGKGYIATEAREVNTALRDQIDAITGVSRATSSARESMSEYFSIAERAGNQATQLSNVMGRTLSQITDREHLYPSGTFNDVSENIRQTQSELDNLNTQFSSGRINATEYAQGVKDIGARVGELNSQFQNLLPNQSKLTKLLGDSLDNIIAKIAAWQVINAAVATVIRSLKEAVATMKEVDSELATIRKVTGMSEGDAKALGDASYGIASQYGVSANEYLQSVATYARAGYMDAAEGLGELAIKTQLVGDTTTEIANQFLLSTDAAWKYKGNIEALSLVLDEANEIDNKYATSIQKIAEGMPIVASVASMAGMSVEETMAALGTITATTQESGTKAATALRALILNILGDTTTEIEDGVTATEESVKSLSGILNKYAPDAVAAAKATGELINPMEAIKALSKAAKDELLTESEMMTLVSSLGGKLRTNQLTALLQNYDMVETMLEDMGFAFGSADKELEIMSDTWERKLTKLQNAWTQFVSHLVDTGAIKGSIDVITGLINVLDSGFTKFAFTVGTVTTAVGILINAVKAIGASTAWAWVTTATSSVYGLSNAFAILSAKLRASPLFYVAVAVAGIYGVVKAVDALTTSYKEQQEIVKDKKQALKETESEYDNLINKVGSLTIAERTRLEELKLQKAELEEQLKLAEALEFKLWRAQNSGKVETEGVYDEYGNYIGEQTYTKFERNLEGWQREYEALKEIEGQLAPNEYRARLVELLTKFEDLSSAAKAYKESGYELTEEEQELVDLADELADSINDTTDAMDAAANAATTQADAIYGVSDAARDAADSIAEYKRQLEELTDFSEQADFYVDAFGKAKEQYDQGLRNTPEISAFLSTVVDPVTARKLEYDVEDMWDYVMKGVVGRVSSAENPAKAMWDEIVKLQGDKSIEGIVGFGTNEQGKTVIDSISSWEELAGVLGVNQGWLEALVKSVYEYQDSTFYTTEEAKEKWGQVAEQLKEVGSDDLQAKLESGAISMEDFALAVKEATGAANTNDLANNIEGIFKALNIELPPNLHNELYNAINAVFGNGEEGAGENTIEASVDADTSPAEKAIKAWRNKETSNPLIIPVETSAPALEGYTAENNPLASSQTVSFTSKGESEVVEAANEVSEAVDAIDDTKAITVSEEGSKKTIRSVEDVTIAVKKVPTLASITINAGGNALSVIQQIQAALAALQSANATADTGSGVGKTTGAANGIPVSANGQSNFAGGLTLVNDGSPVNGSPKELIKDSKGAYIVNGGKPAVTMLEKGAVVYTAEETADILNGDSREYIDAFAGGLISPTTPTKSSSGRARSSSSSGKAKSAGETLLSEATDLLENLNKQIELARNRNDKVLEQELQEEAIAIINEYIEKMLKKNLTMTDNEVLDLLNKGYSYSDDLMNELVESLENLSSATSKANALKEKEQAVEDAKKSLENVQKQRTTRVLNPVTGQWEWVSNAEDIKTAQKELEDAEKNLLDEQISQELEALKNAGIGDISSLTLGSGILNLIGTASEEEQQRIADILRAITGGVANSPDTTGESRYTSSDSHDTVYQFGEITLTEEQAGKMTVKELAALIKELKVT